MDFSKMVLHELLCSPCDRKAFGFQLLSPTDIIVILLHREEVNFDEKPLHWLKQFYCFREHFIYFYIVFILRVLE